MMFKKLVVSVIADLQLGDRIYGFFEKKRRVVAAKSKIRSTEKID